MKQMPEWFEEWVVCETDNWHLKPGAPEDVKREFAEYMKVHDSTNTGIDSGDLNEFAGST